MILETIEEGVVVIGTDKRIIYLNRMAKELIGLPDDSSTVGIPCNEIIKTDLCANNCPLNSLRSNNSCTFHYINVNLYKANNSETVPLCLNVASLRNEMGEVIGIIENFRPMNKVLEVIESLEKSNIVLKQEKNRIETIVNSLADGFFTVDGDLRITSFNRGMEKITGLKESDVVGRSCSEVLSGDNCLQNCPLLYTLKNGRGVSNIKERIAGREGNMIPVFISTAFLKDIKGDIELIVTIRDVSEIEKLRKESGSRYRFSNIIGKSPKMQQIFELIETLGDTDCAVLIEGESGTGKELVARAIHHESDRRNKPFVKVDCSAIVEGLFESELFGHVKGAFTGAIKDKVGKFEIADGGTIFLDEIGEMPLSLQSKLLRVIQDKEFERVGDTSTRRVDVRVIAATNRDLLQEIKMNRFREDLYYRLCVVPIKMPALRERKEDIPLLINHFLEKCAMKFPNRPPIVDVTPDAFSALLEYDWPGNIRELENAIEHAYIRSKNNIIDLDSLPSSITDSVSIDDNDLKIENVHFNGEQGERLLIEKLLLRYRGNKTKVAKALGLSRTTLWRRLKKYNLIIPD